MLRSLLMDLFHIVYSCLGRPVVVVDPTPSSLPAAVTVSSKWKYVSCNPPSWTPPGICSYNSCGTAAGHKRFCSEVSVRMRGQCATLAAGAACRKTPVYAARPLFSSPLYGSLCALQGFTVASPPYHGVAFMGHLWILESISVSVTYTF